MSGLKCPTGHVLPNRTAHGRCSPHDCADQMDLPVTVVVPLPAKFLPGEERQYMLKRLDQVAPAMLEARIAAAVSGDAAAQDALLDRAGFTRKPEGNVDFNGPVLVLNPSQLRLPWGAAQVDGRVLEAGDEAARGGAATAATAAGRAEGTPEVLVRTKRERGGQPEEAPDALLPARARAGGKAP